MDESIHKNKQTYKRLIKDRIVYQLFQNHFLQLHVDECWSWCSFTTMVIDETTKHNGRWWDAILVPSTTVVDDLVRFIT